MIISTYLLGIFIYKYYGYSELMINLKDTEIV